MIVVLDAPSNLGLKRPGPLLEPGTRSAPAALRAEGLIERLGASDAGVVEVPAYLGERHECGVLNAPEVAAYARTLADALAPALDAGALPLVLGGDCSILLGAMLALQRRGRNGLLFLDGHRDLLTPATSWTGGAAGMDLALVTGHGPEMLTALDGPAPLVRPEDVLLFGYRDADRWYEPALLELARTAMRATSLEDARIGDFDRVLRQRLDEMLAQVERFWLHIDADVLDDAVMPAVDSREPGGMTADELVRVLQAARSSGKLAGLHLGIYDPTLDPGRACARLLVDVLERGLSH